jgi:nucleoside-diphosphate-sugar epimerase
VILGAGYTGGRLAARLASDGQDVVVTRRDAAAARAVAAGLGSSSVRGVAVDLGRPDTLGGVVPDDAIVACCAPPGAHPGDEIAVLVEAARAAARIVYVSSTGVYPAAGGAWVDETWPIAPATAAGRARALAEATLAASPIPTVRLRAAGIYGPDRGLLARLAAGTYRIVGDGSSHVSRIHVDDLVEAIVRAGRSALVGPVNVADDDPAPIGEVADAAADLLGVPRPPRVPGSAVDPEVAGMLTADRRIANRRLVRELGVTLRYPSWRAAL